MNKLTWLLPIVALSTACNGAGGVWLLQLNTPSTEDSGVSCTENFINAECRNNTGPGPSDWTHTLEGEQSPEASFAEIFDNADGTAILVIAGGAYIGDKADGVYTFSWDKFDTTSETDSHTSGYSYTRTNDSSLLTEVLFERAGDTLEGYIRVTNVHDQTWSETDVWTQTVGGLSDGQMGGFNSYITGNTNNRYQSAECESDPCRVAVQSTSVTTMDLTGTRTELTHAEFMGVESAGQELGY